MKMMDGACSRAIGRRTPPPRIPVFGDLFERQRGKYYDIRGFRNDPIWNPHRRCQPFQMTPFLLLCLMVIAPS